MTVHLQMLVRLKTCLRPVMVAMAHPSHSVLVKYGLADGVDGLIIQGGKVRILSTSYNLLGLGVSAIAITRV